MTGQSDPISIARAIVDGAARLNGIADNPRLEARLLLAHALGLTQNDLIRDPNRTIDPSGYHALIARRTSREPIALIVGRREFWSLAFKVSPATLVPRPDSETLIEASLSSFAARDLPKRILDLGTGTGCLLLALLHEFPAAFGIGVDLSPEAAALARSNAADLGSGTRSGFIVGNWFDSIKGRFDLMVCNPPYIARTEIGGLMPEVADFEPKTALDGGQDGYDAYRTIVPALDHFLEPDGIAILELGRGQANYVAELAREAGFVAAFRVDLADIPRAIVLSRPVY